MIVAATGSGEVEVVEGEVQCVIAGREDIGGEGERRASRVALSWREK